jgi:hypothetical protein
MNHWVEMRLRKVILELLDSSDLKFKKDGAKIFAQTYGIQKQGERDALDPKILSLIGMYFMDNEYGSDSGKPEETVGDS